MTAGKRFGHLWDIGYFLLLLLLQGISYPYFARYHPPTYQTCLNCDEKHACTLRDKKLTLQHNCQVIFLLASSEKPTLQIKTADPYCYLVGQFWQWKWRCVYPYPPPPSSWSFHAVVFVIIKLRSFYLSLALGRTSPPPPHRRLTLISQKKSKVPLIQWLSLQHW